MPQSSEKAEGQFLPALLAKKGRCRSLGILWQKDSLPLGQVPTNSPSASKQSETLPFRSSRLSDPRPPGCPPLLSQPLQTSAQPRQDECHGQQDPMQHAGVAAAPGGQGELPPAQFPFPFSSRLQEAQTRPSTPLGVPGGFPGGFPRRHRSPFISSTCLNSKGMLLVRAKM